MTPSGPAPSIIPPHFNANRVMYQRRRDTMGSRAVRLGILRTFMLDALSEQRERRLLWCQRSGDRPIPATSSDVDRLATALVSAVLEHARSASQLDNDEEVMSLLQVKLWVAAKQVDLVADISRRQLLVEGWTHAVADAADEVMRRQAAAL